MTDNGSNMLKAVRLTNEELEEHEVGSDSDDEEENDEADEISEEANDAEMDRNVQRFPCLAHTLQLVLKKLGKHAPYTNLITKVRSTVKSIRISSVAQEKLIALCGQSVVKAVSYTHLTLPTKRIV